jgi:DnaJ-class molecular chaperone
VSEQGRVNIQKRCPQCHGTGKKAEMQMVMGLPTAMVAACLRCRGTGLDLPLPTPE